MGDALAAQGTVRVLYDPVIGYVDGGTAAGSGHVPDAQGLDFVAHLDAAHALDALVVVVEEGEGGGPGLPQALGQLDLKGQLQNAQVVGNLLELAVAATHTGGALAVVLGQNELHVDASGAAGPGGVGMDGHALLDGVVAGGDHGPFPLHLHTAHPAGCNFIDALQVAQVGNVDVGLPGSLQNGGAFGHLGGASVNGEVYHSLLLPPLKIP